jgi:HSP20 family protein
MRLSFPLSTEPFKSVELPVKYPATDLIDIGNSYTIKAELPGFTKDRVDIQVNKNSIEIKAEMKDEKEDKGKNYLHRERTSSSVRKVIVFPRRADFGQD